MSDYVYYPPGTERQKAIAKRPEDKDDSDFIYYTPEEFKQKFKIDPSKLPVGRKVFDVSSQMFGTEAGLDDDENPQGYEVEPETHNLRGALLQTGIEAAGMVGGHLPAGVARLMGEQEQAGLLSPASEFEGPQPPPTRLQALQGAHGLNEPAPSELSNPMTGPSIQPDYMKGAKQFLGRLGEENIEFYEDLKKQSPAVQDYLAAVAADNEAFLTKVVGTMGPAIASLILHGVLPGLGIPAFLSLNTKEIYDEAIKGGAAPAAAERLSKKWGIVNTLLDQVGVSSIANAFKPAGALKKWLVNFAIADSVESGTEGTQELVTALASEWAAKPKTEAPAQFAKRMWEKKGEILSRMGDAAAVAGTSTLLLGAPSGYSALREHAQEVASDQEVKAMSGALQKAQQKPGEPVEVEEPVPQEEMPPSKEFAKLPGEGEISDVRPAGQIIPPQGVQPDEMGMPQEQMQQAFSPAQTMGARPQPGRQKAIDLLSRTIRGKDFTVVGEAPVSQAAALQTPGAPEMGGDYGLVEDIPAQSPANNAYTPSNVVERPEPTPYMGRNPAMNKLKTALDGKVSRVGENAPEEMSLTAEDQAQSFKDDIKDDIKGWAREGKKIPDTIKAKYPEAIEPVSKAVSKETIQERKEKARKELETTGKTTIGYHQYRLRETPKGWGFIDRDSEGDETQVNGVSPTRQGITGWSRDKAIDKVMSRQIDSFFELMSPEIEKEIPKAEVEPFEWDAANLKDQWENKTSLAQREELIKKAGFVSNGDISQLGKTIARKSDFTSISMNSMEKIKAAIEGKKPETKTPGTADKAGKPPSGLVAVPKELSLNGARVIGEMIDDAHMPKVKATRQEAIDEIVKAEAEDRKRRDDTRLVKRDLVKGSNNLWYSPLHLPNHVTATHERKEFWVIEKDGATFGNRFGTRGQLEAHLAETSKANSDAYRATLEGMKDNGDLIKQGVFYAKKRFEIVEKEKPKAAAPRVKVKAKVEGTKETVDIAVSPEEARKEANELATKIKRLKDVIRCLRS